MLGATTPAYPSWVGGTLIGVLAGDLIGDPEALGLDAIFPAFFLALLLSGEASTGRRAVIAALLGAAIALALVPWAPPGRADHRRLLRRPDRARQRRERRVPARRRAMTDVWLTIGLLAITAAVDPRLRSAGDRRPRSRPSRRLGDRAARPGAARRADRRADGRRRRRPGRRRARSRGSPPRAPSSSGGARRCWRRSSWRRRSPPACGPWPDPPHPYPSGREWRYAGGRRRGAGGAPHAEGVRRRHPCRRPPTHARYFRTRISFLLTNSSIP